MNGYEFAQQYYKRLADGEYIGAVNSKIMLDGERYCEDGDLTHMRFTDIAEGQFTWAPKTITVTIPAPMTERPKTGEMYYIPYDHYEWSGDIFDKRVFEGSPIWSTEKDRDDAMRILAGGKDET